MSETECIARKWGNSLGIVIPTEIVQEEGIAENETITVIFHRRPKVKEFFGLLSDWKRPTEEIKKDMKKGWE
ncbi:AbrB/MazE/SpoVT family DNA-binding domain-containing protein [Candidatus Woesearchaeota archaeon]|nr:AbrB/MazE/SpoVT family DNA-binding domain-containing protein [Candidatus Woesearchaeota archaeon]